MAKFPTAFGTPIPRAEDILTRRPDPRSAQLVAILADAKQPVDRRISACNKLDELKAVEAQVHLAVALRSDADARVRSAAARALGALSPHTSESVAALLRSLREEGNTSARASAAWALRGPTAKQVTPDLVRALREDKAPEVRAGAAASLKDAAADAPGVGEALRSAIGTTQPWPVRVEAATSLARLSPNDTECIRLLTEAVSESPSGPQYTALLALHNLGPRAAPAVPALVKLIEKEKYDSHYINRTWYAVHTLMRIGPGAKAALPVLIQKLGEDDANPNWTGTRTNYPSARDNPFAFTLARIGPPALPELMKVFRDDKDNKRRTAAVISMGFMGPGAAESLPALESALKSLDDKQSLSDDEQRLQTALKRAGERIRNPKTLPIEELLEK
jgi:HEAT repeat protein